MQTLLPNRRRVGAKTEHRPWDGQPPLARRGLIFDELGGEALSGGGEDETGGVRKIQATADAKRSMRIPIL